MVALKRNRRPPSAPGRRRNRGNPGNGFASWAWDAFLPEEAVLPAGVSTNRAGVHGEGPTDARADRDALVAVKSGAAAVHPWTGAGTGPRKHQPAVHPRTAG